MKQSISRLGFNKARLYIYGIPKECSENELKTFVSMHGFDISKVQLMRDDSGESEGSALVDFKGQDDAMNVSLKACCQEVF